MWRHDDNVLLTKYSVVGINTIDFSYPANQEVVYTVPDNEHITVRAGDIIGWAFLSESVALQFTNTNEGTQVFRKRDPDISGLLLQDSLAEGDIVDINFGGILRDYSIKATVLGEHFLYFVYYP